MLTVGDKIEGYVISSLDEETMTVLANNPNPKCPEPYVVWDMDYDRSGVNNGSYFTELYAARRKYDSRIAAKKEYGRG